MGISLDRSLDAGCRVCLLEDEPAACLGKRQPINAILVSQGEEKLVALGNVGNQLVHTIRVFSGILEARHLIEGVT